MKCMAGVWSFFTNRPPEPILRTRYIHFWYHANISFACIFQHPDRPTWMNEFLYLSMGPRAFVYLWQIGGACGDCICFCVDVLRFKVWDLNVEYETELKGVGWSAVGYEGCKCGVWVRIRLVSVVKLKKKKEVRLEARKMRPIAILGMVYAGAERRLDVKEWSNKESCMYGFMDGWIRNRHWHWLELAYLMKGEYTVRVAAQQVVTKLLQGMT